MQNLIF